MVRLQTLRSTPVSLTVLTRTAQATKVALSVVRLLRAGFCVAASIKQQLAKLLTNLSALYLYMIAGQSPHAGELLDREALDAIGAGDYCRQRALWCSLGVHQHAGRSQTCQVPACSSRG